ncbi:MAG: class I adenylate-forming enzyme family protein [Methanobacteriaceae archaeon]|nr:class I adenylate-forming enzyme family protein [Methanobacteriaceae archaeon]
MLNVTTFLDANASRLNKPVYHDLKNNIRYNSKEILSIVSYISNVLYDSGVKKGDKVIIYLNNSSEYLFSLLAIWRIGAVAIPTNRIYTINEINYFVEDTNAKLIITDLKQDDLQAPVCILSNLNDHLNEIIVPAESTSWDDLCQLQYTSGTTGKPKGAMLTHGNWFTAIQNECDVQSLRQDDVFLCIYPMAHVGISWAISALRAGSLCIIPEFYDFESYVNINYEYNVTKTTGMPPVIHSLITRSEEVGNKLSTVKSMICGGGPLHHEIWKTFYKKYGISVLNAYGLSETIVVGTGTIIRPEDYAFADKFKSVGHPVCFSQVKIVDVNDANKTLDKYEHGEIALNGPGIAKGYWNSPKKTNEVFLNNGWFLTGDIGYLDDDNRLFITDRKKDMIVMSGWKIYPTEVEETLIKYPKVDEIALFSISDDHRGEIPVAAVVWVDESDEEGLLSFANEYLARYKIPKKIFTIDKLPRVNGWKLLRRELELIFKK